MFFEFQLSAPLFTRIVRNRQARRRSLSIWSRWRTSRPAARTHAAVPLADDPPGLRRVALGRQPDPGAAGRSRSPTSSPTSISGCSAWRSRRRSATRWRRSSRASSRRPRPRGRVLPHAPACRHATTAGRSTGCPASIGGGWVPPVWTGQERGIDALPSG